LRFFFDIVGQVRVGANFEKNFGFELEPILVKGMGFLFFALADNALRFTAYD
jgi:hypothetical protein